MGSRLKNRFGGDGYRGGCHLGSSLGRGLCSSFGCRWGGSTFTRVRGCFRSRLGFAGFGFHFLVSSLYGRAQAALAAKGGWQAFRGFTGARLYRPGLTQTETLQIRHNLPPISPHPEGNPGRRGTATVFDNPAPTATPGQTRLCSNPCRRMSLGRSMPMKTILLRRSSPSAHCGPRSLPMSWCTPWKITLRSVPFMYSTPL